MKVSLADGLTWEGASENSKVFEKFKNISLSFNVWFLLLSIVSLATFSLCNKFPFMVFFLAPDLNHVHELNGNM